MIVTGRPMKPILSVKDLRVHVISTYSKVPPSTASWAFIRLTEAINRLKLRKELRVTF